MNKNKWRVGENIAEVNPKIMGGVLCVTGTRIPIKVIITYLKKGWSESEICKDVYPHLSIKLIKEINKFYIGEINL